MGFNEVTAAAQSFAEDSSVFGESFSYQNTALVGVFNQVELDYTLQDFSTRKITALVCVTSKPQWTTAGLVPTDRQLVTYGGITYPIQAIAGANTAAEPAFTLTLFKLT